MENRLGIIFLGNRILVAQKNVIGIIFLVLSKWSLLSRRIYHFWVHDLWLSGVSQVKFLKLLLPISLLEFLGIPSRDP